MKSICQMSVLVGCLMVSCNGNAPQQNDAQQDTQASAASGSQQVDAQRPQASVCTLSEADYVRASSQARAVIAAIPRTDWPEGVGRDDMEEGDDKNYFSAERFNSDGDVVASAALWLFPKCDGNTLVVLFSRRDAGGRLAVSHKAYVFSPQEGKLAATALPATLAVADFIDDFTALAVSSDKVSRLKNGKAEYEFSPSSVNAVSVRLCAADRQLSELLPSVVLEWDGNAFRRKGESCVELPMGVKGVPPIVVGKPLDTDDLGGYGLEFGDPLSAGHKAYDIAKQGDKPILTVETTEDGERVTSVIVLTPRYSYGGFRVGDGVIEAVNRNFEEWNQSEISVSRVGDNIVVATDMISFLVDVTDLTSPLAEGQTKAYKEVKFKDSAVIKALLLTAGEG